LHWTCWVPNRTLPNCGARERFRRANLLRAGAVPLPLADMHQGSPATRGRPLVEPMRRGAVVRNCDNLTLDPRYCQLERDDELMPAMRTTIADGEEVALNALRVFLGCWRRTVARATDAGCWGLARAGSSELTSFGRAGKADTGITRGCCASRMRPGEGAAVSGRSSSAGRFGVWRERRHALIA
jgi:hypothetical protein